jgi:hypothetical protein
MAVKATKKQVKPRNGIKALEAALEPDEAKSKKTTKSVKAVKPTEQPAKTEAKPAKAARSIKTPIKKPAKAVRPTGKETQAKTQSAKGTASKKVKTPRKAVSKQQEIVTKEPVVERAIIDPAEAERVPVTPKKTANAGKQTKTAGTAEAATDKPIETVIAKTKEKLPPPSKRSPFCGNEFVMPDGAILDTSTLDMGGIKLNENEKKFVFFYTFPGTDAFQCMSRAAKRVGYAQPGTAGYSLRRKENVAAAIKYVLDKKVKIDLEEQYNKIIELKKLRINYDIGEYVKKVNRTIGVTKEGEKIQVLAEDVKDLEELTPEQRMVIDSIDYKSNQGIRVYNFADRDKAMTDVLTMYNRANGNSDENDFDVEMTAEIIKGNLSVKVGARKKKEEIGNAAEFVKAGEEQIEEL